MSVLDTFEKREFIKKFLYWIAETQHHRYWVLVNPSALIIDLGLRSGQARVRILQRKLQEVMPAGTGIISKSDILKDQQTVAGFLAVAIHRAKFVDTQPVGEAWTNEIRDLQIKRGAL